MYLEETIIPENEIKNRINNFKILLKEEGIDFAVIMQNADLFYFGGIIEQGFILIPSSDDPVYLVRRNYEVAKKYSPLKVEKLKSKSQLLDFIKTNSKIGLELDVLPFNLTTSFQKLFQKKSCEIQDISNIIKELRSVKTDLEIKYIRKAGMIIKNVFMSLIDFIKEGQTEYEIFVYAQNIAMKHFHQGFMRMRGFNQEMYFGHILSGESGITFGYPDAPTSGFGIYPSFPQGSGFRKIRKGEIVSVDMVGCYNGYMCDQARPFGVNNVSEKVKDYFKIVKEIFDTVVDFIQPGISWEDAYNKGIEIAKRYNVLDNFMGLKDDKVKFFGHGIGIEVDEPPFIAPGFKKIFKEGMTIAIEPKLFFPEHGVIGLENTVILTKKGCEKLTPCEDKIFLTN